MLELLQMWACLEVLGLVFLPLTVTVFHNLPDRGWAFSKAIGLAVLAFCVWLPLMLFQMLPYSRVFILGVLLILVALNILGFLRVRKTILKLIRTRYIYIICVEAIFFGMVFLLGWLRSYGPDIRNFEMFMDEGFLAAIMRSPHLPPNDMWYSGQAINYYYYAHFNIATLAKLLGQSPSIAFNTGISMFFGLTATNLFGVTSNVVAWARHRRSERLTGEDTRESRPDRVFPSMLGAIPYGILSILLGEVLGNLAATQTWWVNHGDLPAYYWFNASRVVVNTINEFPAFSFLLSCFHAHVLALAFTILGIALAFNLFLEPKGQGLRAFGRGWRMPFTLVVTALVIGSLYAMNGWDYPTYLALALVCLVLQQWMAHQSRLSLDLVLDVFTACAALGALSFILFVPFYRNFVSPAQGLGLINATERTPLGNEILIYGIFAFIFLSFMLLSVMQPRALARLLPLGAHDSSPTPGLSAMTPVPARRPSGALSATRAEQQEQASRAGVEVVSDADDTAFGDELDGQPAMSEEVDEYLAATPLGGAKRGWLDPRVIGLLATWLVALIVLVVMGPSSLTFVVTGALAMVGAILTLYHLKERERSFALFLGATACALIAFCEVIFLKDVFDTSIDLRMNTVFKFYFQAWALLSIVGGAGVYFVLDGLKPSFQALVPTRYAYTASRMLWSAALLFFLLMGAVYPLTAAYQRYNNFSQRDMSLDGLDYMSSYAPGDYQAIRWINSHISGDPVIVEAFGPDYSDYGRISAFTGLPTLMGWAGHELQWRINWFGPNGSPNEVDFANRANDVKQIYTNPSSQQVLALMAKYHAQYLYVGPLEQQTYLGANLQRFGAFMKVIYRNSSTGVTIYEVPQTPR